MTQLTVAVLAGTNREQRKSIHAAHFIAEIGATFNDVEVIFVDPRDYYFPGDGNDPEGKDARYTEVTRRVDAFFIVTPEYNHSFPGTLKRMLDSELETYIHKPVAFAGASSGQWGGVRAIEQLVGTVREMGLIATFTDMHFPHVQDLFDDTGKLLDEKYRDYAKGAWVELLWMARVMKSGRENVPSKFHQ